MNKSNNILVSIEGNIGTGKSTLLKKLEDKCNNEYIPNSGNKKVIFLKEPVDSWSKIRDENNVTMLEKFYADQKKYSFSFQMMAYISRLVLLKEAMETNENAIIITERSLFTDRFVFAKMLYDSGNIEFINYQIYFFFNFREVRRIKISIVYFN
jgi:deoxyadenosine/deoxycytidine kinase